MKSLDWIHILCICSLFHLVIREDIIAYSSSVTMIVCMNKLESSLLFATNTLIEWQQERIVIKCCRSLGWIVCMDEGVSTLKEREGSIELRTIGEVRVWMEILEGRTTEWVKKGRIIKLFSTVFKSKFWFIE